MRRTVLLGALGSLLALATPARADWEVRRNGSGALIRQAEGALAARPEDRALAGRLVRLAGKRELPRVLESFQRRTEDDPARYPALVAYAHLLEAAGKAAEAIPYFERAAAARPEAATPAAGLARALRASGDRRHAIEAYERALPLERRAAERRQLLEALVALSTDATDIEHELTARRELVALDRRDDGAVLALADALERAGRPGEAARALEERLSGGQEQPYGPRHWKVDLALRAAALYEASGDYARASHLLVQLLDVLPATAADRRREAWASAIRIARHQGVLGDLARTLESRGTGEPARARGRAGAVEWEALAQVRDELGDLEGALAAARRASALDRRNVELGRRTVALLERLGQTDEAAEELATLAAVAPNEPQLTIELLERLFRRGPKERARSLFDHALQRFTRNREALRQLAELATRWSEEDRSLEAWTRLHRLAPRDELAVLGLGEQLFQRKKRDLALRTWQALRDGQASKAEGHARLAEVLLEHDLLGEATAEAQKAEALEPEQPRYHRTMAQILERQRRPEAAVEEWGKVLQMNRGPARSAERHEARSRLLALAGRDGRVHLNERIRELETLVKRDPQEREAALFLAEAEARNGNLGGAIATLRATIDQGRGSPPIASHGADADADLRGDALLALVRLLRQTRQLDEAVRRLEQLGTDVPARAREAQIQIADIELERYDDDRALEHAERASGMSSDNTTALVRVAEVQERAGETERALRTYRSAFARDSTPAAAFALCRLLVQQGSLREASEILRTVLRSASDDETIAEAGRRAIDLEEYQGTLDELERLVSGLVFSTQAGATYRRVLVDLYRRFLPSIYRGRASSPAAEEDRNRVAQHGLRPLLELLTDADGEPDRGLVELLGMLGNRDAAPALARLARGPSGPASDSPTRLPAGQSTEVQLAAIVALGRLGDGRGRAVLRSLLSSPDASLRVAAVWAYGRVAGPDAGDLLASVADGRPDIAALALLGLGRAGEPRWGPLLAASAIDRTQPARVRRAATLALGLSGDRLGVPVLLDLIDSGDADLAFAAAAALGLLRDPMTIPPLLERAILPGGRRSGGDRPALAALDRFAGGRPLNDDGKAIEGSRIDIDALLSFLCAPPPPSERTTLWADRTETIHAILARALARSRESRLNALTALDGHDAGRDEGLALGHLTTPGDTGPSSAAAAAALQAIGGGLSAQIVPLLDDPDPTIVATALRVLAKVDDERLTPGRIAALIARAPSALADAAAFATARRIARHPESAAAFVATTGTALADPASVDLRVAAVEVLRQTGPGGHRKLEVALNDPSPFVRAAAVDALASSEASVPALIDRAADATATVRAAVARALAQRSTPAVRAVLKRLARDPSPMVRAAAPQIEP